MPSGKKERIVISCVTFEVAKIVEPTVYYEATRVHLIHYGDEGVYKEFYDEVEKQIREKLPKAEIIEHKDDKVFVFEMMMGLMLKIIRSEQKNFVSPEIYVNVSAGPSEYTTASLIASMMMDNVTPFNVATDKYQIPDSKIREVYYDNGHPVGMAKSTRVPNKITTYSIQKPDEKLVVGLDELRQYLDTKSRASASAMVERFWDKGLMKKGEGEDKPSQNSIMFYQRNFINRWISKGWIERDKRDITITDEGNTVLSIFLGCYTQ